MLERGPEAEMAAHVGYERGDPAGWARLCPRGL
ncbi:hypothetical protein FrEUN1fDRAFT_4307 [Parafrankia sp. EUN1f]|nr:hypothetical protein FrEUN1fDRAFT_4307 [Parafrankia sp. EUN1f]